MAFVVFEGLDAAGKSTLIQGVNRLLQNRSQKVVLTQDPGSTEIGQRLRDFILSTKQSPPVPKAELLLYQAARVQMVDQVIRPALQDKAWVLADRFYSSTLAFQVHGRGLNAQMVHQLNQYVSEGCRPDLFVFLDVTVEESQRRKQNRTKESGVAQDRMELERSAFQEKVRQGYLTQAQESPQNWLVLDGQQKPEKLCELVVQEFLERQWLAK